ncbi:HNH endonuclease [Micromonospora purpureochromogenes]|uniref:HNH endonuclease n=1 Tax=Micromonospora purpureochromogenes TaxID=47872 RepID=UPI0033CBC0E7
MPVTHWIYPTNEKSDYYLDNPSGDTEVSPQRLLDDIEQSPDKADPWILKTGFRMMQPGDAVWIYAADPYQYICALAQAVDIYPDGDAWYASLVWNLDATHRLMRAPIPRSEFHQIAQQAAIRADERTVEVLDGWLRSGRIRLADLEREPSSNEDARLRTMRNIVQRQGQATFRQRLLHVYDRRCAVTRESAEAVLEAAHIEPYMGPHSNRLTNGLLLRADLHTLFDLHLIGIDQDGKLVVSSRLSGSSYASLQARSLALPQRTAHRPSRRSLAAHVKLLL